MIILLWYYISEITNKEVLEDFLFRHKTLAPLLFIFTQILQNIVAPIAHYPILLAGGFIFGPVLGFIYNWVGTSIGTFMIILLAFRWMIFGVDFFKIVDGHTGVKLGGF